MSQETPLPFVYQFAAGAIAGVSEILMMYPLDVVKTRVQLQTGVPTAGADHYNGMIDCFRKIVRNEGFSRLYRGISAPILMEAPKRATKFAANDEWGKIYRKAFGAEKMNQSLSILTGAIAGVSEILMMYPLDVVKTRVQLQTGVPTAGADHYNGMIDCFRKIVRNEGFSRLYRGISAPILMEAPKRATKFAANDEWGKIYRKAFGAEKMNQSLSILTGASAGATEAIVVVPFELIKIRMQDKASAGKYTGMLDCVSKTVRAEGILALYNGLESTMWRHVLWNAGYFGCIFQVRQLLPAAETQSTKVRNDLLSGAVGGTVGTILNTPMDVVKSRIQNSPKVPGQVPKYNWAWPAVATVAKEEGFGALYKGFLPKVLRLGPGGGILLVVFTGVMDFFREMKQPKPLK
ncbi:hypothetical protein BN1708_004976 [Verticillium longisporum]|uniref:Mitochondrial thiamine pyrophosphate carrier 1 n=2 Tax=Verticillium longisporum TaxID=100787 RepID=A0A0G4M5F9_VERLO|nr:hypothetical protein BN1708_004976 [Verticillium longisporum]